MLGMAPCGCCDGRFTQQLPKLFRSIDPRRENATILQRSVAFAMPQKATVKKRTAVNRFKQPEHCNFLRRRSEDISLIFTSDRFDVARSHKPLKYLGEIVGWYSLRFSDRRGGSQQLSGVSNHIH